MVYFYGEKKFKKKIDEIKNKSIRESLSQLLDVAKNDKNLKSGIN